MQSQPPDNHLAKSDELPLAGITVVSLEQAVAAPYATRQLADLGCRVIKVERQGVGDFARRYDESVRGLSSYFVWANRSKESLCLDLKRTEGIEVLGGVLGRADVFVQNLAPLACDRLGLSAEALRARRPELIVCDISGYGADGPWADRKAYDLLIQAEVGVMSLTGTNDATARIGVSIADIAAGMYAFSGILAALVRRATTGHGSLVQVSLFDALAEWVGQPLYYTRYSGRQPGRSGMHHPTIAPYGPFPCSDGVSVIVAVHNEWEWEAFCSGFVGDPSLTHDSRFASNSARVEHREQLHALIGTMMSQLNSNDVVTRLEDLGIANARANDLRDLIEHPVLNRYDHCMDFESPAGTLRGPVSPIYLSDTQPRMGAVPDLGEHSDAILEELGYTAAERRKLREHDII